MPTVLVAPTAPVAQTALRAPASRGWLGHLRLSLFVLGIIAVSYYGYTVADQNIYQAFENWSFDQQIGGRSHVTFGDYVRECTPFGFLAGEKETFPVVRVSRPSRALATVVPRPTQGAILGRLSIARLNISAIVREGVDSGTLNKAVGHVPATALAGQLGNFAIAAHRDTLFRGLKNIRLGDQVVFESAVGKYAYRVISTLIVRPSDVSVLRADGGPKLLQQISDSPTRLLTMITCYPFGYVGSAPERFIVQAEAVSGGPIHIEKS